MRRWIDMVKAGQLPRRVLLDASMHALADMAELLPRAKQRRASFRLIEDVEYARPGGQALCLDILCPQGAGPHPVLVYLHGGAFAIGSKRSHRGLAAAYAAQGYLVCNVDYRLAPQHRFPAALEDACAAWQWVIDHVATYGGDPHHIALGGESAGANLALAVTLACCTPRPEPFAAPLFAHAQGPAAVLLYCGFLQVSHPERYTSNGGSALVGRVAADVAHSYLGEAARHPQTQHALADPLCVVEALAQAPGLPPIFIAAGLADPVVDDSQRLEHALRRLQAPYSAHFYPGETHAFHVMFWREQALKCWHDSFDFMKQYLPAKAP